jgi:superoxide dismutase, Fe-Mn family
MGSVRTSAQAPAQLVWPAAQLAWQVPFAQAGVAPEHTVPHAPQFAGSVFGFEHLPPQSMVPLGQPHAPITHACVAGHALPQPPQLAASVLVLMQRPSQNAVPIGQLDSQPPPRHTWPGSQALPQAPQFFGSLEVSPQADRSGTERSARERGGSSQPARHPAVKSSAAANRTVMGTLLGVPWNEHLAIISATRLSSAAVRLTFAPMTRYVLPDLPYDYAALEPHISGRIMALHHDKHHRTYVEGANTSIEKLMHARNTNSFDDIAALERQLAFNVSGHILHSIFWQNLSPEGGDRPGGVLAQAIDADFGSFDRFKAQLIHAASTTMGSGWAALVYDPVVRRLGTSQIHDHQSEITQGGIPLLVLDAWEHAYYLQYQADKDKYFEAIWNLWSWEDVARRYELARKLDLGLHDAAANVPRY